MDQLELNDPADIRAFVKTNYPGAKIGELALILSAKELDTLKTDDDRLRDENYKDGVVNPEEGLLTYPREVLPD